MITSPGYQGVPPAEAFYYNSPILHFTCGSQELEDRLTMNTNEFIGIQLFHTYLQSDGRSQYVELPCYSAILNCAVCGGFNVNKCKLCLDNFNLVNMTLSNNEKKEVCLSQFCPPGNTLITLYNGVNFCKPCSIQNCNSCGSLADAS